MLGVLTDAWLPASIALTVLAAGLLHDRSMSVTTHTPAVTSGVGPVHGVAYLIAIALAWFGRLPLPARLWTLVPGIGALIAYRTARTAAASSNT